MGCQSLGHPKVSSASYSSLPTAGSVQDDECSENNEGNYQEGRDSKKIQLKVFETVKNYTFIDHTIVLKACTSHTLFYHIKQITPRKS